MENNVQENASDPAKVEEQSAEKDTAPSSVPATETDDSDDEIPELLPIEDNFPQEFSSQRRKYFRRCMLSTRAE